MNEEMAREANPKDIVLKPTSREDYVKMKSKLIETPSGAVFELKALGANGIIQLLSILPEEGLSGIVQIVSFIQDNWDLLLDDIVLPSIISPELGKDDILFGDVMFTLNEIMNMSGLGGRTREDRERFRADAGSNST